MSKYRISLSVLLFLPTIISCTSFGGDDEGQGYTSRGSSPRVSSGCSISGVGLADVRKRLPTPQEQEEEQKEKEINDYYELASLIDIKVQTIPVLERKTDEIKADQKLLSANEVSVIWKLNEGVDTSKYVDKLVFPEGFGKENYAPIYVQKKTGLERYYISVENLNEMFSSESNEVRFIKTSHEWKEAFLSFLAFKTEEELVFKFVVGIIYSCSSKNPEGTLTDKAYGKVSPSLISESNFRYAIVDLPTNRFEIIPKKADERLAEARIYLNVKADKVEEVVDILQKNEACCEFLMNFAKKVSIIIDRNEIDRRSDVVFIDCYDVVSAEEFIKNTLTSSSSGADLSELLSSEVPAFTLKKADGIGFSINEESSGNSITLDRANEIVCIFKENKDVSIIDLVKQMLYPQSDTGRQSIFFNYTYKEMKPLERVLSQRRHESRRTSFANTNQVVLAGNLTDNPVYGSTSANVTVSEEEPDYVVSEDEAEPAYVVSEDEAEPAYVVLLGLVGTTDNPAYGSTSANAEQEYDYVVREDEDDSGTEI